MRPHPMVCIYMQECQSICSFILTLSNCVISLEHF